MRKAIIYGFGGYDPTKPNNNIIEEYEVEDPPPSQGELVVSAWTIPADGEHYAVCTFGTDEPVWFTVNGEPLEVPSEQGRATLEIAADAPGAIRVEIHDKQATIMAVTP
jgi:hypothetical protein